MTTPEITITPLEAYPGWSTVVASCPETGLMESDTVEHRTVAEQAGRYLALKVQRARERLASKQAKGGNA